MNIGSHATLQDYTRKTPVRVSEAARKPVAKPKMSASKLDASSLTALILFIAVVASALMLVWSKHQSRQLFQQLEALSAEHDEQQIEWGRLQLEQATWSENSRIEQIARERLGLDFPKQTKVVVIKQ
jgi:cell division protein FtsL